jgi:RIO-like serine/threonine protein kinase
VALFDEEAAPAAQRAATLIRSFIARGLIHADLNLKNIVVAAADAWIIDLDRCELVDHVSVQQAQVMRRRFLRSLSKWRVAPGLSQVLSEAFSV